MGLLGLAQYMADVAGRLPGGTDAFERLRVAQPQTLFDSQFTYDLQPLLWEQVTAESGAAISRNATENVAVLTLASTPANGLALMQTFEHFRYQPGKSQAVFMTFNALGGVANTIKSFGLNDGTNGYEFRLHGTAAQFRVLSSTTAGTQTAAQAAWNIDTMDGTGASGITLDWTKTQILVIDFQALYVGRVRFGWDVDGVVVYAHEFLNANVLAHPYVATANLPLRAALSCSATASTTMQLICCSLISEGGQEDTIGYTFTASGSATAGSGSRTHFLSIQPAATLGSVVNRARLVPLSLEVMAGANPVKWELCLGQALSGTDTFAAVNSSYSVVEVNTAGTLSGNPGIVIASGWVASSNQSRGATREQLNVRYPLTLNRAGTARVLGRLTVLLTGVGGASAAHAALNWKEIR